MSDSAFGYHRSLTSLPQRHHNACLFAVIVIVVGGVHRRQCSLSLMSTIVGCHRCRCSSSLVAILIHVHRRRCSFSLVLILVDVHPRRCSSSPVFIVIVGVHHQYSPPVSSVFVVGFHHWCSSPMSIVDVHQRCSSSVFFGDSHRGQCSYSPLLVVDFDHRARRSTAHSFIVNVVRLIGVHRQYASSLPMIVVVHRRRHSRQRCRPTDEPESLCSGFPKWLAWPANHPIFICSMPIC